MKLLCCVVRARGHTKVHIAKVACGHNSSYCILCVGKISLRPTTAKLAPPRMPVGMVQMDTIGTL